MELEKDLKDLVGKVKQYAVKADDALLGARKLADTFDEEIDRDMRQRIHSDPGRVDEHSKWHREMVQNATAAYMSAVNQIRLTPPLTPDVADVSNPQHRQFLVDARAQLKPAKPEEKAAETIRKLFAIDEKLTP